MCVAVDNDGIVFKCLGVLDVLPISPNVLLFVAASAQWRSILRKNAGSYLATHPDSPAMFTKFHFTLLTNARIGKVFRKGVYVGRADSNRGDSRCEEKKLRPALKSAHEAVTKAGILEYLSHSLPRRRFKYVVQTVCSAPSAS